MTFLGARMLVHYLRNPRILHRSRPSIELVISSWLDWGYLFLPRIHGSDLVSFSVLRIGGYMILLCLIASNVKLILIPSLSWWLPSFPTFYFTFVIYKYPRDALKLCHYTISPQTVTFWLEHPLVDLAYKQMITMMFA